MPIMNEDENMKLNSNSNSNSNDKVKENEWWILETSDSVNEFNRYNFMVSHA
jgi:hypothetical protein